MHEFASWLTDQQFVEHQTEKKKNHAQALEFRYPVAFDDYNQNNLCMGYGLKSLSDISQGEDVFRVKT